MIKSSKQSSKVQQRDLESDLFSSAQTNKRDSSKNGKSILTLKKRQKTSAQHSRGKVLSPFKKRQETEKEAQVSKQSTHLKGLSLESSPSGIIANIQNKKIDTQIQEGDSRHNKTPSTSYSQPSLYQGSHIQSSHQEIFSQKPSSTLNPSSDIIKAATTKQKFKTKEITASQVITPNHDLCDSVNSHNTESSSLDVDMRKPCNHQKKVLHKKQDCISALKKKPQVKLLEKKQQKEKKLFSNQEEYLTTKFFQLLKAIEYHDYQDQIVRDLSLKHKEQPNSDVKNKQENLLSQASDLKSHMAQLEPMIGKGEQLMDLGDSHNSPLMINPNNPIRDPQTKKRLRACANVICGFKSYGGDANFWSRRKFSKGKFFWLCKVCSDAYNKNQYCCFCKQIYFDTAESAVSDGKEWIQCESCIKWNHTDCEIQNGNVQVQEETQNQQDSGFQYFCPGCLKKKQNKQTSDNDSSSQSQSSDPVKMSSPKGKSHAFNLEESDLDLHTPVVQKMSTTCSSMEEQKQSSQEVLCKRSLQRKVITKAPQLNKATGKSTPVLSSTISQQLSMSSVQTRNGKQSVVVGKKF